jgi:hypothetical protein
LPKYYTNAKLSENIAETPEGYLLCVAVPITRTGTFLYGDGETPLETDDGEILISRSKEDIFDKNCIASFEGKCVTINHPSDFVTPVTYKELSKGHMQNVRPGTEADQVEVDGNKEDVLLSDLIVKDNMAIQLVKNGLREVSLGYEAEYEQTGEGTGRQSNIRGNHCALVDKGRAGEVCAINDHKGKVKTTMSKLAEKMKTLFAKAVDEAVEEDKKSTKDVEEAAAKKSDADAPKTKDDGEEMSMDALGKMVKDLADKFDSFNKSKDADKDEDKSKDADEDDKDEDKNKKDDKSEDEDGEESSMEDRLKALETAVAKLLENKSEDADEDESEDDDFEESSMTGDTAARAEILAPGIKAKEKDIKKAALEVAYKTKEGKKVIDSLSGGKKVTFDSAEKVNHLFIAASEILKASRGTGLEKTKDAKAFDGSPASVTSTQGITAEQMNALNAKHYNR